MGLRRPRRRHVLGQSAAELAIFGSIVIFVIGLILRTAFSVSSTMNTSLRAFRRALQESYITANGEYAGEFSGARNSSSVLVVEDRLSIDPSKRGGSRDRFPLMAQGSGTMTHSLFMDINPRDAYDQPVFDMFINGQRFPLSTSRYVTVNLASDRAAGRIPDCLDPGGYGQDVGRCFDTAAGQFIFFRKAYNGEAGVWCTDAADCSDYPPDRRFDLDFDGTTDITAAETIMPGLPDLLREKFGWQWVRIEGTSDNLYEDLKLDIDGDMQQEQIVECSYDAGGVLTSCGVKDFQEGDMDLTVDDGVKARYEDWRAEYIAGGGTDPGPLQTPGLGQDMTMYSFTQDGTLLRNEEGALYASNGQFVRNETKQDHIDIIERVLYISNDTGRFCTLSGAANGTPCGNNSSCVPTDWTAVNWARANGVWNMVNPVEACGNCFSLVGGVDRNKLTCMEASAPVIFVRSRLRDQRKSKWITKTGIR